MKTILSHLPEQQTHEINTIVKAISEIKKVEKIILFGSFARGDFVLSDWSEENGTMRVYESDYDILVIVSHYKEDQQSTIDMVINNIKKQYHIKRSVDIVLESITHVNKMLEENRYFYTDIIKEGILLFDN
jgi:predicted nucleotidyltransferase